MNPEKLNIAINGVLQHKDIDFTVMGLDYPMSDYLNYCMKNMNNIEFIKRCEMLEKPSKKYYVHVDHLLVIQKIDEIISHNRN